MHIDCNVCSRQQLMIPLAVCKLYNLAMSVARAIARVQKAIGFVELKQSTVHWTVACLTVTDSWTHFVYTLASISCHNKPLNETDCNKAVTQLTLLSRPVALAVFATCAPLGMATQQCSLSIHWRGTEMSKARLLCREGLTCQLCGRNSL